MSPSEFIKRLATDKAKDLFAKFYGNKSGVLDEQRDRYKNLIRRFTDEFPESTEISMYSTPGRTEVGGNHTDHNAGRVLAASVDLDLIAVVSSTQDGQIIISSEGYKTIHIDTKNLEPVSDEKYKPSSLIRGVCARLLQLGFEIGGFRACIQSNVPKAAGLSSSAAFEVLMVTILNHLYNKGCIDFTLAAQIAQFAENNYFGKPCGLMDQTACAYGGLVFIDFKDLENPIIEKVEYDFSKKNMDVLIVDTGGDHADLNDDYEALENEMKSVAKHLGGNLLREFSKSELLKNLAFLRSKLSDRAILRALHFLNDDLRVVKQVDALKTDNIDGFLQLITESGESSWMLCQNCYSTKHPEIQGISIALAITEQHLQNGAWRIHGGGFAGTIQVFLPQSMTQVYIELMEGIFGKNACHEIFIRKIGTCHIEL